MTHPRAGPRNGATRNALVVYALSLGGKVSAFVPAPTARTGLPVRPPRKRSASSDPKLFEKPAPIVRSRDTGSDTLYTIRRPLVSLMGAAIIGPQLNPNVHRESPRIAAVLDTPKRSATSSVAGVYTEDPKVLRSRSAAEHQGRSTSTHTLKPNKPLMTTW